MHDGAPDEVIHATHEVRTRVSSWRDGRMLADDVPVSAGDFDAERDVNIPRRLRITVPGREWIPTTAEHPLAPYGQRLYVDQVLTAGRRSHVVPLGWFVITAAANDLQGNGTEVAAADLMQLVLDDRFLSPRQPEPGATFATETHALVNGHLPVTTQQLVNRGLSGVDTTEWVEDRIQALRDVEAAWPAWFMVNRAGTLVGRPIPTVGVPVVQWRHGLADAYVTTTTQTLRDDVYNAVVARGRTPDGVDVSGWAAERYGPTRWGGPFGRRPRFYFSPLITTTAQAYSAAETVLAQEQRRTTQLVVTCPPDPRVYLGDTARVVTADGAAAVGLVQTIRLPLTAAGGPMEVTVGQATWTR